MCAASAWVSLRSARILLTTKQRRSLVPSSSTLGRPRSAKTLPLLGVIALFFRFVLRRISQFQDTPPLGGPGGLTEAGRVGAARRFTCLDRSRSELAW